MQIWFLIQQLTVIGQRHARGPVQSYDRYIYFFCYRKHHLLTKRKMQKEEENLEAEKRRELLKKNLQDISSSDISQTDNSQTDISPITTSQEKKEWFFNENKCGNFFLGKISKFPQFSQIHWGSKYQTLAFSKHFKSELV